MTETAVQPQPLAAPMSLPARLLGVIFSPAATFKSIAAHPKWLGAFLVVLLALAGGQFAFLSTKVGMDAMLDQQIKRIESMGGTVTAEQEAQQEKMLPMMRYIVGGATLVVGTIMTFAFAGILYAVFTALMGGEASYKQVLAISTHAGAVQLLQLAFTTPLNYFRESMSSATNLGVFVPFLDETSVIARFLGVIDLFLVWWLIVLAIGIGVLYRRKTGPIFASFMGVYVVIAAVVAIVMGAISGSH
jgi:hypothetical protein